MSLFIKSSNWQITISLKESLIEELTGWFTVNNGGGGRNLRVEKPRKKSTQWVLWNTLGDARYTKSIYALLSRSIVWSLLCYCVRDRNHCCVLCDVAWADLLLTWYIVHQPILSKREASKFWVKISGRYLCPLTAYLGVSIELKTTKVLMTQNMKIGSGVIRTQTGG